MLGICDCVISVYSSKHSGSQEVIMGFINCEIKMSLPVKHNSFLYWNKRIFLMKIC